MEQPVAKDPVSLRDGGDLVQLPLRKGGKLVSPLEGLPLSSAEPPRALKSLAQIIENDLCHRCGSCVGICPTHVLDVDDDEYPTVKNLSACTDCDLCVKVCPGDEFNAPAFAEKMFTEVPDINDMFGSFVNGYLSYATDPVVREKSTSGGFITALLMSLLELGEIDGALVVRADETIHYKGIPTIARTKEAIYDGKKSKYAIVPTNKAFQEIREVPGRYAIVGLPCQIHGFQKAAELDKRLRERVVLTIGLICHAAIEQDPLKILFENLGDEKKDVKEFIYRVGKHPGDSQVVMNDGRSIPVLFPRATNYKPSAIEMMNILYRLYTPMRCMTCYDSMVEFADIAVGDPWMPTPGENIDFYEGYSYLLTRSQRGEELLKKAGKTGALQLLQLSREASRSCQLMMGPEKRNRAFRLIRSRERAGLPVPKYGFEIPERKIAGHLKHTFQTEMNLITHIFCFAPRFRDAVLRFWLSPVGYAILRVNNVRRAFRTWRKDRRAARLRKAGRMTGIVSEAEVDVNW